MLFVSEAILEIFDAALQKEKVISWERKSARKRANEYPVKCERRSIH